METKIYNKALPLICIFLITIYHAQCKRFNILIMIDEQPCLTVGNFYIDIPSSTERKEFKYIVGSVDVNEDFYADLLRSSSQNVNINFEAIIPDKAFTSKYTINLPKTFLYHEYIIINIYNLDKKKYRRKYAKLIKDSKEYYVVIKTPHTMKFD